MPSPPDIRAIEMSPQPVVLDGDPVEVVVHVSAVRATTLDGWLIAPDETEVELGFTHRRAPCPWQAAHLFRPDGLEGRWRVRVRSGQVTAESAFDVVRRGGRTEVRFADFDARPPQVPRGDLVRLTGRAELIKGGASGVGDGLDVVIAYREDNTCGWRELAGSVTDYAGHFVVAAPVMGSGDWRAEVRTTPGLVGARSEAVFVAATAEQRYETQIVGYRVRLLGREVVHTGRLRGKPVSTWEWLSSQRIRVFYREPGAPSGAFHSAGKSALTVAGPKGRFEVRTEVREGGAWRVEYFGTSRAGGDVSGCRPAP